MRVSCLLFIAAAQLLSIASVAGARFGEISRQLALTDDPRTDAFSAKGLECTVSGGHGMGADSVVKATYFEFWYAMGSTGPVDSVEMNVLETRLFDRSMEGMVWCTSITDADGGSVRHLQLSPEQVVEKNGSTERARELSIIAVNSGSNDVTTDLECPSYLETDKNGATNCVVIKGIMRILAHNADNVDYLIASLRDHIEAAMEETVELLGEITPDIAFLTYLGDSEEEAISGVRVFVDKGGAGPVFVALDDPEEVGDDDDSIGLIIGVTIPLVVGLILAALCMQRRKRETMTFVEYRDMMTSDFVLVGTGDPPGSFHEGLYHYMRDGTRYLSTRCEGCLETRKNSFYTDNNLGTIMEDEEFQDTTSVVVVKGLGAKSSTIDVHQCTSALCNRCTLTTPENETCFVTAPVSPNRIVSDDYDDSHSLFTDIHSTGASPRASDHIEV